MLKLLTWCMLFLFWIVLSGKMDLFHLILGVISTTIVTLWTGDLLFKNPKLKVTHRFTLLFRFLSYSVWLTYQIIVANLHVIYLALHPNMMSKINPQVIKFRPKSPSTLANYILGNSITLTPGTVTIDITKDTCIVHAISDKVAKGTPGDMEKKIQALFKGLPS